MLKKLPKVSRLCLRVDLHRSPHRKTNPNLSALNVKVVRWTGLCWRNCRKSAAYAYA